MVGVTSIEGHGVVLASGGIDSSALLALAESEPGEISALFVDYGQAAAGAEERAVRAVCSHLGVCMKVVRCAGMRFDAGEIRGRNAFLLHTALMKFSWDNGTILMGVHAGTGYSDCSPEFVELMQRSFEFHTGGCVAVSVPFVDWSKLDIYRLAGELGVPVELTYSCENGNVACGACASCRDRDAIGRSIDNADPA